MSATQNEKAARFRALHDGPGAFVIPNPWDVGSARILAGLGFQALATSSAASACALGRRDHGLTRGEALAHARLIVDATDLPVSADLGKGFGDAPEVVAETIRLAAEVGLVGCTIEDATGNQARPLYDVRLAVERIMLFIILTTAECEKTHTPRDPPGHVSTGQQKKESGTQPPSSSLESELGDDPVRLLCDNSARQEPELLTAQPR